ncbi:HK97-gp10 family putative phage morphogenesis protein [Neptunomonas japonica]|uniref:HK97-gp10 family putative phage morphogenesis protein n=1 Tax=Neptunomonas japonica TaxID=417574 RepID=UPI000416F5AC|nr:HK97-gp10 family putative phage morphogenesis protein [Neptunomonas japonica]
MMNESWEITGLDDLERQLTALGGKDGLTALRRASRAAMKPVKEQMIANAPFDDDSQAEHMRDKISMTTKKTDKRKAGKNNALAVRVGPTKKHSQKAIAAEYGTENQEAIPFMRPALYDQRHRVVDGMRTKLAVEIERIVRKNAQ